MRFLLYDSTDIICEICDVTAYELVGEVGMPCDSLRLYFKLDKEINEIYFVKVYDGNRLIFNGICDLQQTTENENGKECFIYARSSAALLIDNEAIACQYNCPSAYQLWFSNCRGLGFECGLPDISSKNSYIVYKGTSCYSAVNNFVFALYGKNIYVTPHNVLKVYCSKSDVKSLSSYNLYSVSKIISRSEPLSQIDYKINSSDSYSYHLKSRFAEMQGIKRKRLLNLSSLPLWQRENIVKKRLSDSLSDYYSVRVVICGACDLMLNDRVNVDIKGFKNEEFFVYETVRSKNKDGEKTIVLLKKNIDGELINYVD